ncbi:MAG: hypothetical protein GY799_18125 [Desulfobulbaceae bacterium]|nr:hypothetical protein [Desulfobulbaceae bacterium]
MNEHRLWRLGFPVGSFERALCELPGDAALVLFKEQQVLIQAQSSVMAHCLILQIDVWSQAIC